MTNAYTWPYPDVVPYPVGNLYIEPTNRCNLRCVMCPQSKIALKKGLMDWDLFVKIVEDVVSYNPDTFIQLFYLGESLLHPRILDMVSLLKQNGLRVHLATNATLLDEAMARGLIRAGLSHITFSFEGTDRQTYESTRIGADYFKVLEHITGFIRLRDEAKAAVRAVVEVIEMDSTRDSLDDFIDRFRKQGVDEVRVKRLLGWAGTVDRGPFGGAEEGAVTYPCNRPWRMLAITWDGLYLPCCVDAERKCVLGDAHEDDIADSWNGDKMRRLRAALRERDYDAIELCRDCKDVEALSERFTFPDVRA